jgi:hypothetical protein
MLHYQSSATPTPGAVMPPALGRQWQAEIDALRAQQQRERALAVLEALRVTRPSP